jgi:hypothetical protein
MTDASTIGGAMAQWRKDVAHAKVSEPVHLLNSLDVALSPDFNGQFPRANVNWAKVYVFFLDLGTELRAIMAKRKSHLHDKQIHILVEKQLMVLEPVKVARSLDPNYNYWAEECLFTDMIAMFEDLPSCNLKDFLLESL